MKVQIDKSYQALIPNYVKNRYKDVLKINELLIKDNFDEIGEIAHSMKGSGNMYGFEFISTISEKIEYEARSEKDRMAIEKYIGKLKDYLDELDIDYI